MSDTKKAAISADDLGDKTLNDVSVADFLQALEAGGVQPQHLAVWPEKKKVELWAEPETHTKPRVVDLIRVIKLEKKKYELEKIPGIEGWRDKGPTPEGWQDPREIYFDDFVRRVADVVEGRLRTRR